MTIDLKKAAEDQIDNAKEGASSISEVIKDELGVYGRAVCNKMGDATDQIASCIQANPFISLGLAFGAGWWFGRKKNKLE